MLESKNFSVGNLLSFLFMCGLRNKKEMKRYVVTGQ